MRTRSVLFAFAAIVGALSAVRADAHPLAPALVQMTELEGGGFEVEWRQSAFKIAGTADKRPILPAHCTPTTQAVITQVGNKAIARWKVDCGDSGVIGHRVGVEGLADTRTDALVRVVFADKRTVRAVVTTENPAAVIPEREARLELAGGYVVLGFEHILGGPDHLLFVFGLLLLVGSVRSLLATITAFTAGHSVTLSLAMLGIAKVPSGPVEVLIAASVFVLAVELANRRRDSLLARFPWAMAGTFGLLHGLGFAGALREVGLPEHEIPLSLLSFNVGIEIGQIAFVLAILLVYRVFAKPVETVPAWTKTLPVHAMGSLAAMWMIERAFALL